MISFSNQMAGMPVWVSDGEIGEVSDTLIDQLGWRIVYLQVSTGWLFGRNIIVPVQKVYQVDIPGGPVQLALSRQEVEASPAAADLGSLDEGYEKELLGYYGLTEEASARTARLPAMAEPVDRPAAEATAGWHRPPLAAGEIDGYLINADGAIVGRVCDLVIDLDSWCVSSLTADLGGFLVPEVADIPAATVVDVDRRERVVHTSISKDTLKRMPRLGDDDSPALPSPRPT
jgi:sporulation protein YlmC with PRC-barrel domain